MKSSDSETPNEKTFTVSELQRMAQQYNSEPWTFPTESQKRWLTGFVESLSRYDDEWREPDGPDSIVTR